MGKRHVNCDCKQTAGNIREIKHFRMCCYRRTAHHITLQLGNVQSRVFPYLHAYVYKCARLNSWPFSSSKHDLKECVRNDRQIKMWHGSKVWAEDWCDCARATEWRTERVRERDYLTSHMLLWIIPSFVAETMTAECRRLKTARTGHKRRSAGTQLFHKVFDMSKGKKWTL